MKVIHKTKEAKPIGSLNPTSVYINEGDRCDNGAEPYMVIGTVAEVRRVLESEAAQPEDLLVISLKNGANFLGWEMAEISVEELDATLTLQGLK